MGAREFGRLVDLAMRQQEMPQARLAVLVGVLDDERVLNETQIRRIREGKRLLGHDLVERLIGALDLDPVEAWSAAGLWPPDLHADEYREVRQQRPHLTVKRGSVQAVEGTTAQQRRTTSRYYVIAGRRTGLRDARAAGWAA